MLYNVWKYIKNPVYREYHNAPGSYKKTIFLSLLKWNIFLGLSIVFFNSALVELFGLEMGKHAVSELFSKYSIWSIFFLACILAPFVEELLFRGPLLFFKKSPYFKYAYYLSVFLFAIVHIFNFEGGQEIYYLAPLLIAPQLIAGFFLGYIRVKFGLKWSILLHASFNTILIGPMLLMKFLNLPLE